MSFAERLTELRTRRGLTQDELGRALGISRGAISMYESGKRFPTDEDFLRRVADFFGVTIDHLLGHAGPHVGDKPFLPPDLVQAIMALPEESRRVFLRAKNLTPEGLRSVVDYIRFKLNEEKQD